jgi:hypothetical protein
VLIAPDSRFRDDFGGFQIRIPVVAISAPFAVTQVSVGTTRPTSASNRSTPFAFSIEHAGPEAVAGLAVGCFLRLGVMRGHLVRAVGALGDLRVRRDGRRRTEDGGGGD